MDKKEILSKVDHTILTPNASWIDVKKICDDAVKFQTASICIAPSYVSKAKNYLNEKVPICTVVGFPNGYNTTYTKCKETFDAIENGASEIDMVINLGWFQNNEYEKVLNEIKQIKNVCENHILKVIVETCLWDENQKIDLCKIVSNSGADFIKTSTGFSKYGATKEDVSILAKNIDKNIQIKAAGGIKSWEDAEMFIRLGASRLGTSSLVKLAKENFEVK